MELFFVWFIIIIVTLSIILPLCACGVYYLVVFVFLKKAHDSHRRNRTPAPYVITETVPPTIFSNQPTAPAYSNAAFVVDMNNQHQIHHQTHHQAHMGMYNTDHQNHMDIHNAHHQMHMDMHNSAVNSQTTDIPTFHSEAFSAPSHNDFSSDKNDTSTGFTSNDTF